MAGRWHRATATLVLLACAAGVLAGCAPPAAPNVCVPELSVTPDDPRPGRIVTVETTRSCPGELPEGARWDVRIQPEGERIPIARASVDPEPDGSFAVSITVPPTIAPGRAVAHIANYWDYASCPGSASCAAAAVIFDVRE